MWHITDSHLNLWHSAEGDVRDMCRSFAKLSAHRPGIFGHFNCDPSQELLRLTLSRMREVEPEPTLILLGGDVFGHVPASHEDAAAVRESQRVQAELIAASFPRTTVVPVVGNHDTWPYFTSGGGATDARASLAKLYLASGGTERAGLELRERGYYVHRLPTRPDARRTWVVCLETNALSLGIAAAEANEQLAWLESTLAQASAEGAQVLLLGHIAPGASHIDWDSMAASGWSGGGWTAASQQAFYRTLRRWPAVLCAAFFGHLHTGSVRLLRALGRRRESTWASASSVSVHVEAKDGFSEGASSLSEEPAEAVDPSRGGGWSREHGGGAWLPVMYLSPSLTPRNPTPHEPAVRLFTFGYTSTTPHSAALVADARGARRHSEAELRVMSASDLVLDIDRSNARQAAQWSVRNVARELNLSALTPAAWASWADSLLDDAQFAQHMPAQRCADEVEPDYAKCKASVICAMVELEPRRYAKCINRVRASAIPPLGWREAEKRKP